ncbi:MAG: S-layer homology domain-containing protein [Clostridiales bacterium]|nr:S-layer homology domain-containing protein [Eubacteriales bacterium]MDH7567430.1 S-layer homology domain-containing protein [Clostridiales bacterium]
MRKSMKVLLTVMVVLTLLTTSLCSVYAKPRESDDERQSSRWQQQQGQHGQQGQWQQGETDNINIFEDVDKDFWAYQAILDLTKRGILNGYSDKTFKPNANVTRSEFAKMLTKTLNLTSTGNTQTFADVPPSSWEYNAVEAAKNYLTGYQTSNGTLYFYGSRNAVREDMAVALVKALNLTVESDNGQLQQIYTDYNAISPNLRNYVYTAYKDGIMIGSNGMFAPQGNLTRAQAATLLERALQKTEKVTVDDSDSQKVVVGNSNTGSTLDTDATLSNLTVNGTTVSGFAANIFTYNVVLPAGTTAIPTVAATVNDTDKAAATIVQAAGLPGTATVIVTAQDGITQKIYTVNFTVSTVLDTDATLSNLTVNGTTVAGFNPATLAYNVVLPAGTTVVPTVVATVNDTGKATAVITPAASLPGTTIIQVTAQDGTTKKIYTINFTVAALDTDATLSSLTVNGSIIAGFNANTLTYNVVLPMGTTAVPTVAAAVNDTGKATATVIQATGLPGTATVVVTAQDRTTQKVYTINFTVSAS